VAHYFRNPELSPDAILPALRAGVFDSPTTFRIPAPDQLVVSNRQGFRQLLLDAIERGGRELVVDLLDCTYIDSSGFGMLVAVQRAARVAGGTLLFVRAGEDILALFELTKLDTLFQVTR
jgi:anti-sigma B factor antagonist